MNAFAFFVFVSLFGQYEINYQNEEAIMYELDISDVKQWIKHKDWLANPAEKYKVSQEEGVLNFSVQEAGQGMKWSRNLIKTIDSTNMPYVLVRYRAEGISRTGDYFLYFNGKSGDSTEEIYAIMPSNLEDDGKWRTAIAKIPPAQLSWMAIQVQAQNTPAYIQIKSIKFSSKKPIFSIPDILDLNYELDNSVLPNDSIIMLDISPYCNANSNEKLVKMELKPEWFMSEQTVIDGIPFKIVLNPPNLVATKLDQTDKFSVPINEKAGEIYLLIGAIYNGEEEPSIGRGKINRVSHVERFVIEIEYTDGIKDFVFPANVYSDRHTIEAGIGVYRIVPTRDVKIRTVKIHDKMRQGEFFLAGLTIRKGFFYKPRLEKIIPVKDKKIIIQPEVPIQLKEDSVILNNGYIKSMIDIQNGLILKKLGNGFTDAECLIEPSSFFAVKLDDKWINSSEFKVTHAELENGSSVNIYMEYAKLRAGLKLSFNEYHQLVFKLKFVNLSNSPIKFTPSFLMLKNIFIKKQNRTQDDDIDKQWYCFPRRGTVINNIPISLNEAYSGSFPMQFIDIFHPNLGGIFVMKHDLDDEYKWFKLKKDNKISLQIDYMEKELKPEGEIGLPEVVIGAHPGDWHEALDAYKQWVKSWYQPSAPRKQWFREIFNFRQQFMHFALPRKSRMFDNETKEYHFREVIEKDIANFGGVDYLHIFDWGWSEKYGRCGDYNHWEQIGGAEAFRNALKEIQDMGIPVGLYIEGYLVDPESNIGKARGEEWQLLGPDGNPYGYFAPSYNICSAVADWQNYLAETYARVWRETGVNGFYIDEMGFADPGHFCYNPNHGHPIPEPPLRGQRELVRKVREALPPDVAVYTEESPVDVNSQYQDGSFTYAISTVSDELSPAHLNLYRFAFPDFKTFEIIVCDRPLGSDYQSVKKIFFNGEGIWLEGIAQDWFTKETLEFIRKMNNVIKAHVEAFTSLNPTPLIPVLFTDIYANEFAAENETVWTIYNARYSTVRGELLKVNHKEGATYYDAWNKEELIPRIKQGYAYLELELKPRDVGCIVQNE